MRETRMKEGEVEGKGERARARRKERE